jgi:hypothetical protein
VESCEWGVFFCGALELIVNTHHLPFRSWNWRTGDCVRVLEGHTDGIICLNYDKEVLASGSADSTIKVSPFPPMSHTRPPTNIANHSPLSLSLSPTAPDLELQDERLLHSARPQRMGQLCSPLGWQDCDTRPSQRRHEPLPVQREWRRDEISLFSE